MLVLAEPRPPENRDVVPEQDVTVSYSFMESSRTEFVLLERLIDPTTLVPLSALAARARHREKVRIFTFYSYLPVFCLSWMLVTECIVAVHTQAVCHDHQSITLCFTTKI